MRKIENKSDAIAVVDAIFGCAGVVIDMNWITYPTENEEGYEYDNVPIIGFSVDSEDYDPIVEFSVNDIIGATIDNGEVCIGNTTITLLTKLNLD